MNALQVNDYRAFASVTWNGTVWVPGDATSQQDYDSVTWNGTVWVPGDGTAVPHNQSVAV